MISNRVCRTFLLSAALLIPAIGGCGEDDDSEPTVVSYHTYETLDQELHWMAIRYPLLSKLTSIGRSIEGRQIWALKISDFAKEDEDEPVVVFLGCHHAREWISVEVPFHLGRYLLERYYSDPTIAWLVNHAEIWVIPMINPDGHQYSVVEERLWRKNRRVNGDGTFGVDLNRNYRHQWGGPGSSGETFDYTYRGTRPFSEPETRAVRDFLENQARRAVISYHNFSQEILYPWGCTYTAPPKEDLLTCLSSTMAYHIKKVHWRTYEPMQGSLHYIYSGNAIDWIYQRFGAPSFTVELRSDDCDPGFRLPEDEIVPTCEENLPAALFMIEWVIKSASED